MQQSHSSALVSARRQTRPSSLPGRSATSQPKAKGKGRRIQIGQSLLEKLGENEHVLEPQRVAQAQHGTSRRRKVTSRTLTATSILMDWNNEKETVKHQQEQEQQQNGSCYVKSTLPRRRNTFTAPSSAESSSNNFGDQKEDSSSSSSSSSSDSSSTDTTDSPLEPNINETKDSFLPRQLAALGDSDDEDAISRGNREPLRPGDVISYYNPVFIYGNIEGYRVTQVLGTKKHAKDGCLDLDNGEYLPADTRVRRVGEFRRGKVHPRRSGSSVARDICHFRMRTCRLTSVPSGLERQVARLRQTVLQAREDLQKVPPKMWKDIKEKVEHECSSVSSIEEDKKVAPNRRQSEPQSTKKKKKKGKLEAKREEHSASSFKRETKKPPATQLRETKKENSSDSGASSDDSTLRNIAAFCEPGSEGRSLAAVNSDVLDSDTAVNKKKRESKNREKTRRPDRQVLLSSVTQQRKEQQRPNEKRTTSVPLLESDDSDDVLLFEPVFKKSASTPSYSGAETKRGDMPSRAVTTGATPVMASLTLAEATPPKGNLTHDSGSSPLSQSLSSNLSPARLAHVEDSPTLQGATAISLLGSSVGRNLGIRSGSKAEKKKRRKSSRERKNKKKPKSP